MKSSGDFVVSTVPDVWLLLREDTHPLFPPASLLLQQHFESDVLVVLEPCFPVRRLRGSISSQVVVDDLAGFMGGQGGSRQGGSQHPQRQPQRQPARFFSTTATRLDIQVFQAVILEFLAVSRVVVFFEVEPRHGHQPMSQGDQAHGLVPAPTSHAPRSATSPYATCRHRSTPTYARGSRSQRQHLPRRPLVRVAGVVLDLRAVVQVVGPDLGQVERVVQQGGAGRGDAGQEDADLAVVLLAEPAAALPQHCRSTAAALPQHCHWTPTTPRGQSAALGASRSAKTAWISACTS